MIKIKRAYEPETRTDGYRVLIDRLWPRGVKKTDLKIDDWIKDLAPSNEIRKAFGHEPSKWKEFRTRYRGELRKPAMKEKLADLARLAKRKTVTLVYAAKDEEHNNAVVLKELLDHK